MDSNNNEIYNTSNVYKPTYIRVSKNLYKPIWYTPYNFNTNYPEYLDKKEIGGEQVGRICK